MVRVPGRAVTRRSALRLSGIVPAGMLLYGPRVLAAGEPDIERGAARWLPWILYGIGPLNPPSPPAKGSEAHASEVQELRRIQRAAGDELGARVELWDARGGIPVWNTALLEKIQSQRTDPLKAARAAAVLNTAIADAVIACWNAKLAHARPSPADAGDADRRTATGKGLPSYPSEHAAIAGAASIAMSTLYPGLTTLFGGRRMTFQEAANEVGETRLAAGAAYPSDVAAGRKLGEAVAVMALARARTDGSDANWVPSGEPVPESYVKEFGIPERENVRPIGPSCWVPTPPLHLFPPLHPLGGNWRTWLLTSGRQFPAPPPPASRTPFPSKEFLDEVAEVKRTVASLTEEQRTIARFWADNPGQSPTPPGHWIKLALDVIQSRDLGPAATSRVLALLSAGLADAGISCWSTKYTWWVVRPITAIRTMAGQPFHDPGFDTPVLTPPFPSYTSGHSSFSGCAAKVLEALLPGGKVEDALGARVTYAEAAEQAAMSRLYGGIHYRSDNEQGLVCGRKVADVVLARAKRDEEA